MAMEAWIVGKMTRRPENLYGSWCPGKFAPWTDLVTDVAYNPGVPMASVFVPTAETSSLRYFLDMMISLRKPIMFVGGAGVGACIRYLKEGRTERTLAESQ